MLHSPSHTTRLLDCTSILQFSCAGQDLEYRGPRPWDADQLAWHALAVVTMITSVMSAHRVGHSALAVVSPPQMVWLYGIYATYSES